MITDDEVQEFILYHAQQAYDPQKRREYYLRTRELKGRRKGRGDEATRSRGSSTPKAAVGAKTGFESDIEARKAQSKERRESNKARIEELERKLERLDEIHKKLVAEAKLRAGIEPEDTQKSSTTKSKTDDKKKLTTKEKKEAAERAQEARDKEQKKTPAPQEIRVLERKIAEARVRIAEAKAKLEEAERKKSDKKPKDGTKGR